MHVSVSVCACVCCVCVRACVCVCACLCAGSLGSCYLMCFDMYMIVHKIIVCDMYMNFLINITVIGMHICNVTGFSVAEHTFHHYLIAVPIN